MKYFEIFKIRVFLMISSLRLFIKANRLVSFFAVFFYALPIITYIIIEIKKVDLNTFWGDLRSNYSDLFPVWMGILSVTLGGIIYFTIIDNRPSTLDGFLRIVIHALGNSSKNEEVEIIFPSFNPGAAMHVKLNRKYSFYKKFTELLEAKLEEGIKLKIFMLKTDIEIWKDFNNNPDKYNSINEIRKIQDPLFKFLIDNATITHNDFLKKLEYEKKLVEYFHESAHFLKTIYEHNNAEICPLKEEFAESKVIALVNRHDKHIFIGTYAFEKGKDFTCNGILINNKPTFDALILCKEALLSQYAI